MNCIVSLSGEGEVFHMEPGSLVRFKVFSKDTGGLFEMYERELPPRMIGADPHFHRTTVETFYVVHGTATILCGDTKRDYDAGSIVVVPKNTVHAYANHTDFPLKVLIAFTPGLGHEEFFRGLSRLKHGPVETYQADLDALRLRFDSVSQQIDNIGHFSIH
jgi:quercetin dioxygenase-like cupin family protein